MMEFKDKIDEAVGTLRGYCAKVKDCKKMPVQRSQRGMPLYAGDAALRLGR